MTEAISLSFFFLLIQSDTNRLKSMQIQLHHSRKGIKACGEPYMPKGELLIGIAGQQRIPCSFYLSSLETDWNSKGATKFVDTVPTGKLFGERKKWFRAFFLLLIARSLREPIEIDANPIDRPAQRGHPSWQKLSQKANSQKRTWAQSSRNAQGVCAGSLFCRSFRRFTKRRSKLQTTDSLEAKSMSTTSADADSSRFLLIFFFGLA